MTGTLIKLAALAASLAVVFRYGRREQGPGAVRTEASLPAAPGWECGDRIIRDQGVGALRIGANVDSIKKVCHVVRDVVRLAAEGMPAREIMVAFPPTQVEAEVVDGRVWRIAIASPEFVTPDSIRVGTSLRDLLRIGDAQGAIGEGRFFALSAKHCGLSFELPSGIPGDSFQKWDKKALSKLPASVRVQGILVYDASKGCPGIPRIH